MLTPHYFSPRFWVLALSCIPASISFGEPPAANPNVIPGDHSYPLPPSPCCESCTDQDAGDGAACAHLPSCSADGSVFFAVGLGRTSFTRDFSFTSMMAKTGKQEYIASRMAQSLQTVADFSTTAPLTGLRSFSIWYHEESLTTSSFDASALTADPGADSERIVLGTVIRQVLTKDYFADIQPLADVRDDLPTDIKSITEIPSGAPGFVIRTWFAGDQTAKDDGLYGLPKDTGGALIDPLGYVVFYRKAETEDSENPNEWTRTLGIIHRVKSSSSTYKTQSWTHLNDSDGNWTTIHYRDLPSSDDKLSRNIRTVFGRTSANEYSQTNTVEEASLNSAGTIGTLVEVSNDEEVFDDIGGLKRLVSRTQGANLATSRHRTTLYGWVNTPSNAATHGRLAWEYRPDGSFVHHTYTYSTGAGSGSIVTRRPWGNTTWTPGGTAPANAGCVVETTTFTASSMTVVRKFENDDLISSEESAWSTDGSGYKVLTHKTRYGTNVGDVLTTTTAYHPPTAAAHLANRIAWRVLQDGTAEKYSYTSPNGAGVYTQTVDAGAGNSSGVTEGRRTVSDRNAKGIVTSQTEMWFTTSDDGSVSTLSSWVVDDVPYNGGTLNDFDYFGRPQGKVHNGNTSDYQATIFSCCGIAYQRDRTGRQTEYFQDELHRHYKRIETTGAVVETTTTSRSAGTSFDGMVTETRRTSGSLDLLVNKRWVTTNGELDKLESPDEDGIDGAETTSYTYDYTVPSHSVETTNPDGGKSKTIYYADGRTNSITGTAVSNTSFSYEPHTEQGGGVITTRTLLTAGGGTGEWVKTYTDLAGRRFRVEYPSEIHDYPTKDHSATTYYDHNPAAPGLLGSLGKIATTVDPDGVAKTYTYDASGDLWKVTETMPNSAGNRVVETLHDGVSDTTLGGSLRTITKVNGITVSTSLQAGDGYGSSSDSFGRETLTTREVATDGDWTETTTNPDGARMRRIFEDGRLDSVEKRDNSASPGVLISSTSYGYDALGRVTSTTDSRTGTTTFSDLTESGNVRTQTNPGTRVTTFEYDKMGRRIEVDAPQTSHDNITLTSYTKRGEVEAVWGDNTYPTFRTFDEQGRMTDLRTNPTIVSGVPTNAGGSLTTWNYSSTRGWLDNKRDADSKGADYTYTAAGRLETRTWARIGTNSSRIKTSYGYDEGMLESVTYANDPTSTPKLSYTYDSFGQPLTVTQIKNGTGSSPALTTITYTYDQTKLTLDTETIAYDTDADGTSDFTRLLDRSQDDILRPSGWELKNDSSVEDFTIYGYDAAGRFATLSSKYTTLITDENYAFKYEYESDSYSLVDKLISQFHTHDNEHESSRNVIESKITEKNSDSFVYSSHSYIVNDLGQRTSITAANTGFGTQGSPYSLTTSYTYNARGELESADTNHTSATYDRHFSYDTIGNREEYRKGTATNTGGTLTSYTPNELNQYDFIGALDPGYDTDGNMTSGPLPVATANNATLVWDAENRLVSVTRADTTEIHYSYDALSRRTTKQVGTGDILLYIYDGWNMIAQYSLSSQTITHLMSFTWGLDVSGSMQGAGGVGGLLAVRRHSGQPWPGTYYPAYDANGNITEYLNSSSYSLRATYDAFGNIIAKAGPFISLPVSYLPFRFSTKYQDEETGLYYYGYRYFDPVTGRWPSRDPMEEKGGLNLYGFVGNNSVNAFDLLGLVINDGADALAHWRSKAGGTVEAGEGLITTLRYSIPFLTSKRKTRESIEKAIRAIGRSTLCPSGASGKISRSGGTIGVPNLLNWSVGSVDLDVKPYDVNWKNSGSTAGYATIEYTANRSISFTDTYAWNASWNKPKTWLSDSLPEIVAGDGASFDITGSWTDKIKDEFSICCWFH